MRAATSLTTAILHSTIICCTAAGGGGEGGVGSSLLGSHVCTGCYVISIRTRKFT